LRRPTARKVVALGIEEQVLERDYAPYQAWADPRAQAAVDLEHRVVLRRDLVGVQRVAEVRAHVQAVDEENVEDLIFALRSDSNLSSVTSSLTPNRHLARLWVDDVFGADSCHQLGRRPSVRRSSLACFKLADGCAGELAVLANDNFITDLDVARGALSREEVVLDRLRELLARLEEDGLRVVEDVQQFLGCVYPRALSNTVA
jgi:hypothetical protein